MKLHGNAALSWSGRRRLADRVLVEGWTLSAVAEAAGVSVPCARKWVACYRAEGESGLHDRSSAPKRVANRTVQQRVEVIVALRKLRFTRRRSRRRTTWLICRHFPPYKAPGGLEPRSSALPVTGGLRLYQESRVDLDVMGRVRYPRAKRQTVIDVFSEAECIRLLQQPDRDRALIRLLLEAGLRKGEARRLQLRHLDVEQSRLEILEGKGGKDRVIPIPPDLVEQLVALAIRDGIGSDDHLWYATRTNQHGDPRLHRERPIGEATFARWWRTCCDRARVAYRNPHTCLHTFTTRWLRDGGRMDTLAKSLGHSSIRTTVDLYAHLATEDVAADLARVIAARETRLRDQSEAQTRINKRVEAPSGLEPLYEALQASA